MEASRLKGSNMTSLQNYVQVDAANEQEYIVVKDRDKKHTVFIVFIDRRQVKNTMTSSISERSCKKAVNVLEQALASYFHLLIITS